jgi:hypothetical protein
MHSGFCGLNINKCLVFSTVVSEIRKKKLKEMTAAAPYCRTCKFNEQDADATAAQTKQ